MSVDFDIFLSYSSTDATWVQALKSALDSKGVRVWLDKDQIRPGDRFAEALERGLSSSRCVALIVSPSSVRSGWVKEEYYRAVGLANSSGHELRLIPVVLKDAELPGFLQSRSWVDFRDPSKFSEAIETLVWGITGAREGNLDYVARKNPTWRIRGTAIVLRRRYIAVAGIVLALVLLSYVGVVFLVNRNSNDRIYVGGSSEIISIISRAKNKVIATVSVGAGRHVGMAFTPAGRFLYVPNEGSHTVSVIDTSTNSVVRTIPVGTGPTRIVITKDGAVAYVVNGQSNSVSVIDTTTATMIDTIRVGSNPSSLAITPDGNRLFVTNFGRTEFGDDGNTVSVIDCTTRKVVDTIRVGANPSDITIVPDGKRIYVTNFNSNTATVISTINDEILATLAAGDRPIALAVSPSGTRVYIANDRPFTVSVIATASNAIIDTIPTGGNPSGLAFTRDGKLAYVTNRSSDSVSVIDTIANRTIATIGVGAQPFAIAVAHF